MEKRKESVMKRLSEKTLLEMRDRAEVGEHLISGRPSPEYAISMVDEILDWRRSMRNADKERCHDE